MVNLIIDCYTDEPAGLGVPPYLGVYPRYLAGQLNNYYYLTIDDLRLFKHFNSQIPITKESQKTNIKIHNLTNNYEKVKKLLEQASNIYIVVGVHTPGKYLSALPGTLPEVTSIIKNYPANKILCGPASTIFGTKNHGGKIVDKNQQQLINNNFNQKLDLDNIPYPELKKYATQGAKIVKQIPWIIIAEIETGRGCSYGKCSFCTDALKHKLEFREQEDIHQEINKLRELGVEHFRLGKQTCFYSYKNNDPEEIEKLLKPLQGLKTLHIDNVNPLNVISKNGEEITGLIVKYCTSGNIAAFGVESFDPIISKENNLNCNPEIVYQAVKIINKYGKEIGNNGMPKFLPGINIIFGLKGETKDTNKENIKWLKRFLDEDLLLRRINIRQVIPYPGTNFFKEVKNKVIKKNKKYYWKWRNEIRQEIDYPMLKKLLPEGTILKNALAELYDGKTTFCRQLGSYPIIIGVKKRLELNKFYDIKITKHMLRSVTGEIVS